MRVGGDGMGGKDAVFSSVGQLFASCCGGGWGAEVAEREIVVFLWR